MTITQSVRSCFGDYPDCPCDDECVVSKECELYANLKLTARNSCGLSDAECSEVEEWRKQEHKAALKAERERVLDKLRQWGTNDGFVQLDTNTGKHFVIYIQDLKDKIESLRGEP